MRSAPFLVLSALALSFVACGGDDDSGFKGDTVNAGGSGNAAGGTSANGGTNGALGGVAALGVGGGSGGASGAASGIAGGTGVNPRWNDSVTEGCATWPASKLMPKSGLFFYGPDPGPCRLGDVNAFIDTAAYTYDASGRVQTYGNFGRTVRYNYQGDLIVSFTIGGTEAIDGKVSYETGGIVVLRSTGDARFELDARGYPRRVLYDDNRDGTPDWGRLYQYENCRLAKITQDPDLPLPPSTSSVANQTYEYDAEGHITAIRSDSGSVEMYDYACWP